MKILRLTESDVNNIIRLSVEKILRENYNLSDEEYNELQKRIVNKYEKEDEEMQDDYDSYLSDTYNQEEDYYEPGDGDLYRYGV